ncbi:c-type cytochrome [Zhongshania sp. BJYM1]|uniref:c-type cytochrome n=1 Tax=Zhongshania aquatica TaxID=2965069 RepID=UPI0022B465F2|nr:c-type cytochrome [Marortus sp. BJYM1]
MFIKNLFTKILFGLAILTGLTACGPGPSENTNDTSVGTVAVNSRNRMPADPAIKSLYIQSCYGCHSAGVASAPRSGNDADWAPRLQKGMDMLLYNTINGINSMPPKGMCMGCSEEDFTKLISFLSGQSE